MPSDNEMANPDLLDLSIDQINSLSWSKDKEQILIEAVQNINVAVTFDKDKLQFVLNRIHLDKVFDLVLALQKHCLELAKTRRNEADTLLSDTCSLLDKLLNNIPVQKILTSFSNKLLHCLESEATEDVEALCVHQIYRATETDQDIVGLQSNKEILLMILKKLGSSYLSMASVCRKALIRLFNQADVTSWLFTPDVETICQDLLRKDVIIRMRVYEVFADFVSIFPDYVEKTTDFGIFNKLTDELKNSDDVLSQLNALEVVTRVGTSGKQGLQFIYQRNIHEWLASLTDSTDPFTEMLIPGALKFFGHLAHANPLDVIPSCQGLLERLIFHCQQSGDPTLKILCIETLCHIMANPTALKMVFAKPEQLKDSVRNMGAVFPSASEDMVFRSRVLEAIAGVFTHDVSDVEVSNICEKIYQNLGEQPMQMVFDIIKQPFPALKYGGYKVLLGLSKYSWAEQDMALCAGFIEFMLNRSTESEKEGRELKYSIIQTIAQSTTSLQNLGLDFHNKVTQYASQGPFYAEKRVEISYEQE